MRDGGEELMEERMMAWIERRWLPVFGLFFVAACVYLLQYKWGQVHWLALSDTDDNMRLAEVKAWLNGQAWFDLRQHKLSPPEGLNIHWSRIVDLPIAAMLLIFTPIFGDYTATRIACAVAPMLALAPALWALIVTVRRLVHPRAYPVAFAILMCAQTTLFMWMPLRLDHHGWQLAMLTLVIAGLADPNGRRGGATAGLAAAVSFGIGLELIPMMAIAGASIALRWVWDRSEAERMAAYAITLGGGCAIAYGAFASYDNRQMVCDVLSPVYLSSLLLTGALLLGLSFVRAENRGVRFALLIGVGAVIATFYAINFPQCLGRPEAISPELERMWFNHIREVKPLTSKPWRDALNVGWLPIIGALGALAAFWRARKGPTARAWASIALLSLAATAGLAWQSRFGPQAQLLGVFGATAMAWLILPKLLDSGSSMVRVGGTLIAFFALSGLAAQFVTMIPKSGKEVRKAKIEGKAGNVSRRCSTVPALRQLDTLPAATMLTFVDMSPRLIAMTRHSAIAGPYHRNGDAILDVQQAFRATSPEVAHEVMQRRRASMLLLCPGMAESTIYRSRAPNGFYVQLINDQVPAWLEPVELPEGSPFKLWRMVE